MRVQCPNCGGDHPKWDCKRPAKKSTAARKDVQSASYSREGMVEAILGDMLSDPAAGTQALPVDTILKPGRPSTGFDKKAYNRQYMRDKRAGIRIPKRGE